MFPNCPTLIAQTTSSGSQQQQPHFSSTAQSVHSSTVPATLKGVKKGSSLMWYPPGRTMPERVRRNPGKFSKECGIPGWCPSTAGTVQCRYSHWLLENPKEHQCADFHEEYNGPQRGRELTPEEHTRVCNEVQFRLKNLPKKVIGNRSWRQKK